MSYKEEYFDEIMKNADMSDGLDLGRDWADEDFEYEEDNFSSEYEEEEYGYEEEEVKKEAPEKGKGAESAKCCHKHKPIKPMKINCDLEVGVGNKNKVIYVCPGRVQYFTANAISCCGDETIEIKYIGHNKIQLIHGKPVIKGCLGYYIIVKSGIIFVPNNFLSEFPDNGCLYPTDILTFKAKDKCSKDVEFVVVFTYSRCVNCCPTSGCGK